MNSPRTNLPADSEELLRQDIRFLGQLLGETLRQQEGEAALAIVERIRGQSVHSRREQAQSTGAELAALLDGLSREQTLVVVRAFTYFSQLATIAEDQHHIRAARAGAIADSPPDVGSLAHSLSRALDGGVTAQDLHDFFAKASIEPVLTAHPTEVKR